MNEKVVRISEVCEITGYQRSSIYNRVKTGEFPAPIPLGPRASGWLHSEVMAWIESRAKLRGTVVRPKVPKAKRAA